MVGATADVLDFPCDCGSVFDDADRMVIWPHRRIHDGLDVLPGRHPYTETPEETARIEARIDARFAADRARRTRKPEPAPEPLPSLRPKRRMEIV